MASTSEILVVDLNPDRSSSWPTAAGAGSRVLVVQADASALDELAGCSRYALARHADGRIERRGDGEVLDDLDAGERLFVEGWIARPTDKSNRVGEGLSWDSPGFEPPDLPPV